jgi:hypothetical protein
MLNRSLDIKGQEKKYFGLLLFNYFSKTGGILSKKGTEPIFLICRHIASVRDFPQTFVYTFGGYFDSSFSWIFSMAFMNARRFSLA